MGKDMSHNRAASQRTLGIAALALLSLAVVPGVATAQNIGVFVTSNPSPGSFGGLSGGDGFCNGQGLPAFPGSGPWVAWLSTDGNDARDRIAQPGAGGAYVLAALPTTVIADNLTDLTDGTLDHPIERDENGVLVLSGSVWTGTNEDGTATGIDCSDWTDSTAASTATVGSIVTALPSDWSRVGTTPCNSVSRLYCFGSLPTVPAIPSQGLYFLLVLLLAGGAYLCRQRQAVG
ncbi:MAG: DUF1554 domain-containing protein [bacterium]|nr:DUF1554 domain-containing protein [bacterium]